MAIVAVTDGEERSALAVTRSLGKAGHTVVVTSTSGRSLAGASRYAARDEKLPSALEAGGAFFDALHGVLRRARADVLIPISEATLRAVLPRGAELAPVRLPFPPDDAFARASDKGVVLTLARALGISEPTVAVLSSKSDLRGRLWETEGFPLVLKPTRSVVESPVGARKTSVQYVESVPDLEGAVGATEEEDFPLLVQRRVEGPGEGVFLLMAGGVVAAAFGHRRIREKPPAGGVSVLAESVRPDPSLVERSAALLRALGWEGVAMVEYKRDRESGEPVLMEVNARFWGSLQLAIDSGIDFPALLVEHALGRPVGPQQPPRAGVQTRWTLGDFDHLLAVLSKSRKELGLPESAPGRLAATGRFLRGFFPPVRSEICRPGDRRPAARELRTWISSAMGHR